MKQTLGNLPRDGSGATAVEYGLILALIALATVIALAGIADENTANWRKVAGISADAAKQTTP